MARNPLWQSAFYYLSDMYDDSIITEFLQKKLNGAYNQAKIAQDDIIATNRYKNDTNTVYEFSYKTFYNSVALDDLFQIERGSYYIQLPIISLPIYDMRKFISVYGKTNQQFPVIDLYKRSDIFYKVFSIRFDDYCFNMSNLYIGVMENLSLVLIIRNSSEYGIPSNIFSSILSGIYGDDRKVYIKPEIPTSVFKYTGALQSVLSGNTLTIPKSNKVVNILECTNENYTVCISDNSGVRGINLLISSLSTSSAVTDTSYIFTISDRFRDYISRNNGTGHVSIEIIQKSNYYNGRHVYLFDDDTSDIKYLPFNDNPSIPYTMEIYKYDDASDTRRRTLYRKDYNQKYFPNVFDVSEFRIIHTEPWVSGYIENSETKYSVTYGNNVFIISTSEYVYRSTDGRIWTRQWNTSGMKDIVYGNKLFVGVGNGIYYGITGTAYNAASVPISLQWNSITYGNGRYVVVGNTNRSVYSQDGKSFNSSTIGVVSRNWISIVYGGGYYVAISDSGYIVYTTNGQTWTEVNIGASLICSAIAYGNGRFVIIANDTVDGVYKIAHSTNGQSWDIVAVDSSDAMLDNASIIYASDKFITITHDPINMKVVTSYSRNGIAWTKVITDIEYDLNDRWVDIAYGDNKFVAITSIGRTEVMKDTPLEYRDIAIELTEYTSDITNQVMDNQLSFLSDKVGEEAYARIVNNGYMLSNSGVNELALYNPTITSISERDYYNSTYFGDYRGYILDKLTKLMATDPYLYYDYYEHMRSRVSPIKSYYGGLEYFGLDLPERQVNDTSIVDDGDIITFDTTHTYIKLWIDRHVDTKLTLIGKYIVGREDYIRHMIVPTTTKYYRGHMYIFYPTSAFSNSSTEAFKEFMRERGAPESAIIDENIDPIHFHIYMRSVDKNHRSPEETVVVNGTTQLFEIFKDIPRVGASIRDIIVIDTTNNTMYRGEDILNTVRTYDSSIPIDNRALDVPIIIHNNSKAGDKYYPLRTVDDELYRDKNSENIYIPATPYSVEVDRSEYLDSLVEAEIYVDRKAANKDFRNKEIDFFNTEFSLEDGTLVGRELLFTVNNQVRSFNTTMNSSGIFTAANACIDNRISSYRIYANTIYGFKDITEKCSWVDAPNNTYGSDISFSSTSDDADGVIVVHLPYDLDVFIENALLPINFTLVTESTAETADALIYTNMVDPLGTTAHGIFKKSKTMETGYIGKAADGCNLIEPTNLAVRNSSRTYELFRKTLMKSIGMSYISIFDICTYDRMAFSSDPVDIYSTSIDRTPFNRPEKDISYEIFSTIINPIVP